MAEPTHDEHLTQIRDRSRRLAEIPLETSASNYIMRDMIDSIGDVRWLLEQVEQQQTLAATMAEPMSDERIEHIGILLSAPDVGGVAQEIARELLAELKRARAQLAEIGETREEWAVRWPTAGGDYAYELCEDEQDAREAIPDDDYTCEIVKRFVGGWQQVEQ